jgi:hypothetical protein
VQRLFHFQWCVFRRRACTERIRHHARHAGPPSSPPGLPVSGCLPSGGWRLDEVDTSHGAVGDMLFFVQLPDATEADRIAGQARASCRSLGLADRPVHVMLHAGGRHGPSRRPRVAAAAA